MHDGLKAVVKHFHLGGTLLKIMPLAQGHINDTYILISEAKGRIVRHGFPVRVDVVSSYRGTRAPAPSSESP